MVDIKKLKQLREETGLSYALCKKALEATNNDIAAAKKKLQDLGAEKIEEKSTRPTVQGGIFNYTHFNKQVSALVEIQCETDFVSGNEEFTKLGNEIAMQVASLRPKNVEELLEQDYIREPGKKIKDLLKEAVLKFGENIKISRLLYWQLGKS